MKSKTQSLRRSRTKVKHRKDSKSDSYRGKADACRAMSNGPRSQSSLAIRLRDFQFNEVGVIDHVADQRMAYIDVDHRRCPSVRAIHAVCRIVGVSPLWICLRRSAHGWHVIVHLRDKLDRAELIAFQACCGSDLRREALNLMRSVAIRKTPISDRFWLKRWNILFERKLR